MMREINKPQPQKNEKGWLLTPLEVHLWKIVEVWRVIYTLYLDSYGGGTVSVGQIQISSFSLFIFIQHMNLFITTFINVCVFIRYNKVLADTSPIGNSCLIFARYIREDSSQLTVLTAIAKVWLQFMFLCKSGRYLTWFQSTPLKNWWSLISWTELWPIRWSASQQNLRKEGNITRTKRKHLASHRLKY